MSKSPPPICKAFLLCRRFEGDQLTLIGSNQNCHHAKSFPSAEPIAFFARLSNFHGPFQLDTQLQDENGNVHWRLPSREFEAPSSPLQIIDFKHNIVPVFPAPGNYFLVLLANEDEVGREPFFARLRTPAISR